MKLIVDMNLSVDWAAASRAAGFDAAHWSEIGRRNAPDHEIVAWAQAQSAVVLTRDLDFAAVITRAGLGTPSVIQLRIGQVRPDRHLPLVRRALALHRTQLEQGAIITLEDDRMRVRILDRDDTI